MLFDMTSRKPAESAGKPAGCSPSGGVAAALLSEREEWQAWAARAVQNESPPPRGERRAPRRRVAPTSRSSMRRARRCPLWGGRSLSSPWRGVPSGAAWPVSLARPSESVTLTIPKGTAHPFGVVLRPVSRLFAVRLHCSLATCWCPRWSWAEVVAAQPCQSGECRVPHRETSLDFHPTLLCGRRRPCAALCCGRRPAPGRPRGSRSVRWTLLLAGLLAASAAPRPRHSHSGRTCRPRRGRGWAAPGGACALTFLPVLP